jgi:hypothetical protein
LPPRATPPTEPARALPADAHLPWTDPGEHGDAQSSHRPGTAPSPPDPDPAGDSGSGQGGAGAGRVVFFRPANGGVAGVLAAAAAAAVPGCLAPLDIATLDARAFPDVTR